MIEEIATVLAVHADGVEVVCFSKSACGQCKQNSRCGTGLVSKALPGRDHRFVIATDLPLVVDQQVRIGIPEQSLISSALLVYLLPLLLLLGGAGLASVGLGLGDGGTLAGAAIGGVCGFVLASRWAKSPAKIQAEPVIIGLVIPVANID
ncbi:SoxR reducing system RseC family protein [Oceanisphaera sp. KMM 10153]|uniref:SoxR reducing system RseC family protein n=1 Tax=Oceanisphaera submarina TaxID=3390193 RepID=UPI0039753315